MIDVDWNPEKVEQKIGIHFKKSQTLLLAMMHPSYAQQIHEPDENNQRLEFLGDTILNLVVVDYLYEKCPYLPAKKLSALRNKLVKGETLSKLWFQLGLGDGYPFLAGTEDRYTLSQRSNNPFGDALKALVGAIQVDRGFIQARNWLRKYAIAPVLESHLKKNSTRVDASQQLKLLGDALFKAVVCDYLYDSLPYVSHDRLANLGKVILSQEMRKAYLEQLTQEEWEELERVCDRLSKTSFKTVLAASYLNFQAQNHKNSFKATKQWFASRFIDDEEILRSAIAALLKEGRPQKWIVRYVLGYASKDYQAGREYFHELMDTEAESN